MTKHLSINEFRPYINYFEAERIPELDYPKYNYGCVISCDFDGNLIETSCDTAICYSIPDDPTANPEDICMYYSAHMATHTETLIDLLYIEEVYEFD